MKWTFRSVMHGVLTSLTAVVLFIHTVFGCCWHHAHCFEHGSTVAVNQPLKCCRHHQHSSDSKQQEEPCKGNVECKGTCIYVVPQKVKVEAPQWVAVDLLAVLPLLADQAIGTAGSCEAGWSSPDLVPPVRTHLLHQVLLN